MFWEALLDLAKDEDRALLIAQSDTVWGYLEGYLDLVVNVFAQRVRRTRRTSRPRRVTVAPARFSTGCARSCGHDRGPGPGRQAGFDLAGPYCPFTAQLGGASVAGHADLASRLRARARSRSPRVPRLRADSAAVQLGLVSSRRPAAAACPGPAVARARLGTAAEGLRAMVASRPGRGAGDGCGRRISFRSCCSLTHLTSPTGSSGGLRAAGAGRGGPGDHAAEPGQPAASTARPPRPRCRCTATRCLYRVARIEKLTGLSLREQRTGRSCCSRHLGGDCQDVRPASGEQDDPSR